MKTELFASQPIRGLRNNFYNFFSVKQGLIKGNKDITGAKKDIFIRNKS